MNTLWNWVKVIMSVPLLILMALVGLVTILFTAFSSVSKHEKGNAEIINTYGEGLGGRIVSIRNSDMSVELKEKCLQTLFRAEVEFGENSVLEGDFSYAPK